MPTELAPDPSAANLPNITAPLSDDYEKIFTFSKAEVYLRRLIKEWDDEITETDVRRKTRDLEIDVDQLRKSGELEEDETFIPVRVIDTNIQREQPPFINYLKNSRRIATFNCLSDPKRDTQRLEMDYTQGTTYLNWEIPHYRTLDGAQTHGWAASEVVFDTSKPLHVAVESIEHDKLIFPCTILDLQQSPLVLRAYDITKLKLEQFVKQYGFSAEQVNTILDTVKDTTKENETLRIYKKYCKYEGVVYVAWFSLERGVNDWLKAPEKYYIGIRHKEMVETMVEQIVVDPMTGLPTTQQVPQQEEQWTDTDLELYPIFLLPYRETEKPKIFDHKGRVYLDENKQEAHSAILSAFVNGLTRASNIYASPEKEDGTGSSLKELQNIKLRPNRILNNPMRLWSPNYPDPMVLNALQYFDVSNSQETNQVNFAAMNRQDSRKTAREITAAQEQQSLINSVQLTLFSTYVRSVYSFMWLIVQSQALQDKISFLLIEKQRPVINPVTQQPVINEQTGQPQIETYWENDYDSIQQVYDVRAAGDVDYIKRQEKIQQMMQDWPVIQQTPLRDRFLADMLRLKYPDVGDNYSTVLTEQGGQMQQMQSMIGRLSTMLEGSISENPAALENLPEQQRADLMQTIQQAKAMMPQQPTA